MLSLLQVLCRLQETHNPNWVAQLCFLSNMDAKGRYQCGDLTLSVCVL